MSVITGVEYMTLTVGDMVGARGVGLGFTTPTVTPITIATIATASATSPHTNPRRRRSGCASTNGASVVMVGSMGSGWMTSSASASSSRSSWRGSLLDTTSGLRRPDVADSDDTKRGTLDNGSSREGRDDDV